MENNQNIQPLVNAQQERKREREDNDQKVDPENTFSEFCEKNGLNRRSPITKHLKAIFVAGWDETRLEVGELINHTTSELFKWNNLFRSMLAVFIVIGLLGTLFGLTDSLVKLAPALRTNAEVQNTTENNQVNDPGETSTENSKKMVEALSKLMDDIKGAFAPSIWGIIFTIVGVILYGFYLQFAYHPVKSVLERLTLTVWVPQLYPTTSQRLIQTLQQSESQIQKGFETAAQFSESVEKVHGNIDEFNESLKQASAITQPLSDSVTQINRAASDISTAAEVLNTGFTENLDKFSEKFTASVTQLTGFQDQIRELHQEFQQAANEKLDQQNQNLTQASDALEEVLNALKAYETAYIDSRKQMDETLKAFISKATETHTSIYKENREWFEKMNADNQQQLSAMQDHLAGNFETLKQNLVNELKKVTSGLAEKFGNFQEALDSRLEVLNERLENFDTPLKEIVEEIKGVFDEQLTMLNERLEKFNEPLQASANQMRNTYADSVRYMQRIFGDLQQEINKQNEKYEAQLTGVRNLNRGVLNLLQQLDESSKNQSTAISTLNSKVESLTENTQNLTAAITSFTSDSEAVSDYVAAIGKHTETLGNTSQQFVEKMEKADVTPLNVNIEKLNTIIGDISQKSQTLADAVNGLERQINASESEPSPKRSFFSKLNRFFSKLNPFS